MWVMGIKMEASPIRVNHCSLSLGMSTNMEIVHPFHPLLSVQNFLCLPLYFLPSTAPWHITFEKTS